jgi:hypothetical protein
LAVLAHGHAQHATRTCRPSSGLLQAANCRTPASSI